MNNFTKYIFVCVYIILLISQIISQNSALKNNIYFKSEKVNNIYPVIKIGILTTEINESISRLLSKKIVLK